MPLSRSQLQLLLVQWCEKVWLVTQRVTQYCKEDGQIPKNHDISNEPFKKQQQQQSKSSMTHECKMTVSEKNSQHKSEFVYTLYPTWKSHLPEHFIAVTSSRYSCFLMRGDDRAPQFTMGAIQLMWYRYVTRVQPNIVKHLHPVIHGLKRVIVITHQYLLMMLSANQQKLKFYKPLCERSHQCTAKTILQPVQCMLIHVVYVHLTGNAVYIQCRFRNTLILYHTQPVWSK